MTTPADLHDRLGALADLGAHDALATDLSAPAAAWQRGLGFRRRRRIGTAAIVVVALALLAGLGGTAFAQRDTVIAPAGSNAPAGLPDRFFEVSPWLAGTDDEGPLGRLAVLIPAQRKDLLGRSEDGLVGISATTGEYRFVDLPDRAEGGTLSPDGRKVAYWSPGPITGTPNSYEDGSPPASGLAIHDAETGETTRASIESEHGLMVDDLVWVDDATLAVGYGDYRVGDEAAGTPLGKGQGTSIRWYLWSVDDDLVLERPLPKRWLDVDTAADGRILADKEILDPRTGTQERLRYRFGFMGVTALDALGTRVALPGDGGDNSRVPNTLQVTGTDGTTTIVPDSKHTYAAIGWSDKTHVAVHAAPAPGHIQDLRVDLIDIEDGTRVTLIDAHGVGDNSFQLATDLLSEPTLDAVDPPHPLDPRWVIAGLLSIVGAAGIALLRWRRRVAA